ncbi:MAG: DUF1116 domain-containing protein [Thermaerobacter sp.]|nr:DUF1116 domain-containing protein [Thermaerobacter sp.]
MGQQSLLGQTLKVINVGTPAFNADLRLQGVPHVHLDWRPPAEGDVELLAVLSRLAQHRAEIESANDEVLRHVKAAIGRLVGVKRAREVVLSLGERTILHAGPPVDWKNMAGPMRGAIIGALVYEGWAKDKDEAANLAKSGGVRFAPCHEHGAVGPMAGIISPSMPVHVLHDPVHGNYAYCTVNEGLGKVLRYGAYSEEVLARLGWIEKEFAPVLDQALALSGGIDVGGIIAQALHMGDECHNRNKAAGSLFLREIMGWVLRTDFPLLQKQAVLEFIKANDHYFLNLSMPYCKLTLQAGHGVPMASIVTIMARNGYEFGIKISSSDKWFTGPANYIKGLLFPGYSKEDAAPDIGDSAITETMGIGGFAMGGAPAIVKFVGGSVQDALNYSLQMHEICHGENGAFTLPALDFRATPLGIDIIKVVETGVLPIINTGMAHKEPGVGQVGAGLVSPPFGCFRDALVDFDKRCSSVSRS